MSEFAQSKFTHAQMSLKHFLDRNGIKNALEFEIPRWNEWHGEKLKVYSIDILLLDPRYLNVAIEVEGDHSSTTNNQRREKYLERLGIPTYHTSNETAIEFPEDILKDLNEHFRRVETDWP